jgi:hypothetical protein
MYPWGDEGAWLDWLTVPLGWLMFAAMIAAGISQIITEEKAKKKETDK